jgi:hypothetical protein
MKVGWRAAAKDMTSVEHWVEPKVALTVGQLDGLMVASMVDSTAASTGHQRAAQMVDKTAESWAAQMVSRMAAMLAVLRVDYWVV